MTFSEDYKRAVQTLRELNATKVTLTRRQELAKKTIKEQLEAHRRELEQEFGRPVPDQADIDFALRNDKGWEK